MYEIEFSKQAIKDLQRIPKNYAVILFAKIKLLAVNPYDQALDIKKLKAINGYRLRVGEYRVIYEIEKEKLLILIVKVQIRGNVYG
jgi:mRNA interferase RelE/StbE